MNTIELLAQIQQRHPQIASFSFHTFPAQQLIQQRMKEWGTKEEAHFHRAMQFRERYKLPFWDSVMLATFNYPDYSQKILRQCQTHNSIQGLFYATAADAYRLLHGLQDSSRLAVSSYVRMTDGSVNHLPMLDFHIPISDIHTGVVKEVCRLLHLHDGYLLDSGESYHYIASHTASWDELNLLLVRALRFSPIIDRAWISHQLEEKCCSLRIDRKHGVDTRVIEQL